MIKKSYLIVVPVLVLFIVLFMVLLIEYFNRPFDTSDWNIFKKELMSKYPNIQTMSIDGFKVDLNINYISNGEVDSKITKKIFEETKRFILTKSVFEKIQQVHIKKYEYSFSVIHIDFYNLADNKRYYQFFSSQEVGGTPKYDSFRQWMIKCKDEEVKEYPWEAKGRFFCFLGT